MRQVATAAVCAGAGAGAEIFEDDLHLTRLQVKQRRLVDNAADGLGQRGLVGAHEVELGAPDVRAHFDERALSLLLLLLLLLLMLSLLLLLVLLLLLLLLWRHSWRMQRGGCHAVRCRCHLALFMLLQLLLLLLLTLTFGPRQPPVGADASQRLVDLHADWRRVERLLLLLLLLLRRWLRVERGYRVERQNGGRSSGALCMRGGGGRHSLAPLLAHKRFDRVVAAVS